TGRNRCPPPAGAWHAAPRPAPWSGPESPGPRGPLAPSWKLSPALTKIAHDRTGRVRIKAVSHGAITLALLGAMRGNDDADDRSGHGARRGVRGRRGGAAQDAQR